ncbi:MAG: polysaccharide pyruvyl transferase family protein [Clostridia bacterium]|nr:polysaccharide pyruvyl transferase family protein [Clostridia bacterium]
MKKIVIYGHGSALNHGCEAIMQTTSVMVKKAKSDAKIILSTLDVENDKKFFSCVDEYIVNRDVPNNFLFNCIMFANAKLMPRVKFSDHYRYKTFKKKVKEYSSDAFWISAGGDNYCAKNPSWLYMLNDYIDQTNGKRILWGASVEPDCIGEDMLRDLNGYSAIFARESITRDALIEKGYKGKIYYHADPAFTLPTDMSAVSEKMQSGKWIGLNLSPVVMGSESLKGVTYKSYYNVLDYLIKNTDYHVALIPHVVIDGNSDYDAMAPLYKEFEQTGRVLQIPKTLSASQYKGIISKCSLFIGARTHATIAAYSNCIPTLVVGYSVKAKGIAKDLFGDYNGYVLPVQEITNEQSLLNAVKQSMQRMDADKAHLQKVIPDFINSSAMAAQDLEKVVNGND